MTEYNLYLKNVFVGTYAEEHVADVAEEYRQLGHPEEDLRAVPVDEDKE